MGGKGRSFCHIAYQAGIGRLAVMPMRKGGCKIADEATIPSTRFCRYHRNRFSRTSTLSPIFSIDIDIGRLCICFIILLQCKIWRSHLHNQSRRVRQSSHISSPLSLKNEGGKEPPPPISLIGRSFNTKSYCSITAYPSKPAQELIVLLDPKGNTRAISTQQQRRPIY